MADVRGEVDRRRVAPNSTIAGTTVRSPCHASAGSSPAADASEFPGMSESSSRAPGRAAIRSEPLRWCQHRHDSDRAGPASRRRSFACPDVRPASPSSRTTSSSLRSSSTSSTKSIRAPRRCGDARHFGRCEAVVVDRGCKTRAIGRDGAPHLGNSCLPCSGPLGTERLDVCGSSGSAIVKGVGRRAGRFDSPTQRCPPEDARLRTDDRGGR